MARKPVQRTLQLKAIQFSKPVEGLGLYQVMKKLNDLCPAIGNRLWEDNIKLEDGSLVPRQCYFYNNLQFLDDKSCFFEVWSYEPGSMPPTLVPNPLLPNAQIDLSQWNTEDGARPELIHISRVLVYGKAAIVESTRGTGGVEQIRRYLNKITKDYNFSQFRFYLSDAISSNLAGEIRRGGGATGFSLAVSAPSETSKNPLMGMLSSIKKHIPATGSLTVDWKSKSALPTDAVVRAYSDAKDDEEVDSIIIHLKNGSTIRRLSKYKVKQSVEVTDIGGKNPHNDELAQRMIQYLEELLSPDAEGGRVLNDDGALAANEIFTPNSRRNSQRS